MLLMMMNMMMMVMLMMMVMSLIMIDMTLLRNAGVCYVFLDRQSFHVGRCSRTASPPCMQLMIIGNLLCGQAGGNREFSSALCMKTCEER